MQAQGEKVDTARIDFMKKEYGFDKPPIERYFWWVGGILHGDFGYSFEYQLPVRQVVGDRVWLTILLSFSTIVFTWLVAFPIGIYSATHQYSWGDYGLTTLGLLGLAIPHFLLALIFLYFSNQWFGLSIGGLMDPKYFDAPMSWDKFLSILSHLWIPVIIIGTAGTGSMIRAVRANLLEELHKQYVVTARSKGLSPMRVLFKYPFRMSLNFFISDIGSILPSRHLGRRTRRHRAVAADDRPAADPGAAEPGHLSRRLVPDDAVGADRGRRPGVGRGAGLPRSAYPHAGGSDPVNVQAPLQAPGAPLAHYVSDKPFDVGAVAKLTPAQERIYFASQWRLMWWKFKRHRMAVVSSVFLILIYATLPVSEFLAPYEANTRQHGFHPRAAPERAPVPRRAVRRTVRLRARLQAQHGEPAPRLYRRPQQGREAALLLPRRPLSVLGSDPGRLARHVRAGRRTRCSSGARTGWAATCSPASSTAPGSR